jgi:Domain of unknown function (DUF2017)
MRKRQRRIRRTRRGDYELRLPVVEREILRKLPDRLRRLLSTDDPALFRLFPPAYGDDVARNAEFEELVKDDLVAGRMTAIDVMERTIDAERVDEDELLAWLGSINDLRLVLGTVLDVTEQDMPDIPESDPRGGEYALFYYLAWLEEQLVEELSEGVDPKGSGSA